MNNINLEWILFKRVINDWKLCMKICIKVTLVIQGYFKWQHKIILLPEPKLIVVIPGLSIASEFSLLAASAVYSALFLINTTFRKPSASVTVLSTFFLNLIQHFFEIVNLTFICQLGGFRVATRCRILDKFLDGITDYAKGGECRLSFFISPFL